jgi:hypothetical protein
MWTAGSHGNRDKRISFSRKNTLKPHGEGDILEIPRLTLTRDAPSGGARDDGFYFLGNPKNCRQAGRQVEG